MTKVRVSITIDEEVADGVLEYLRGIVMKEAAAGKKSWPNQSNAYEEVLRRGLEAIRGDKEKA